MISFRDKVILITGASSGIGAELARQCARRGSKVILVARSQHLLQNLQEEISGTGGTAFMIPADITRPEDIRRMMQTTLEYGGRLDVLVNNAGFGVWGHFEQLPMELIRKNFELNVFAAVACTQAAIPQFRKQKSGMIVNIESIVALRSMPISSCYCATKHALHAFSESLRVELAAEGIQVISACPGLIHTPFHQKRIQVGIQIETGPKWLYISVEKCVRQIVRAMEHGHRQVVITGHAKWMAFVQRISPQFLDWILVKNYRRALRKLSVQAHPSATASPPPNK